MTPEETATIALAEAEETAVEAVAEAEEQDEEEDFNPLGKIEGWSAFECSSGPFGHRG